MMKMPGFPMGGVALGGTHAALPVAEKVTSEVQNAVKNNVRAVKIVVEGGKSATLACAGVLPRGKGLEEDFEALKGMLEESVPCICLVHVGENDTEWALLAWTPDSAPVKTKMTCAASRKTVKEHFKTLVFREFDAREAADVGLAEFLQATRALSEEERLLAMTTEEVAAYEARKEAEKEQKALPKKLAGMAALAATPDASFTTCLKQVLEGNGKAAVVNLEAEILKAEILQGEVHKGKDLQGRLPKDARYVVFKAEKQVFVLLWVPEVGIKLQMTYSTFLACVLKLVKEKADEHSLAMKEVKAHNEEDLAAL